MMVQPTAIPGYRFLDKEERNIVDAAMFREYAERTQIAIQALAGDMIEMDLRELLRPMPSPHRQTCEARMMRKAWPHIEQSVLSMAEALSAGGRSDADATIRATMQDRMKTLGERVTQAGDDDAAMANLFRETFTFLMADIYALGEKICDIPFHTSRRYQSRVTRAEDGALFRDYWPHARHVILSLGGLSSALLREGAEQQGYCVSDDRPLDAMRACVQDVEKYYAFLVQQRWGHDGENGVPAKGHTDRWVDYLIALEKNETEAGVLEGPMPGRL